jgi:hypothetical protein
MNVIFKKIIFTGLVLTAVFFAEAQSNFSAEVTPARINKDEYATLRFIVQNARDIKHFIPPSLKGFSIISGPNAERGLDMNGTSYLALNYVLKPSHSGVYRINTASAIIDGKKCSSEPVKLVVINSSSGNNTASPLPSFDPFEEEHSSAMFKDYVLKKGENVAEKVSRNMQLRLQTDKTSCYVGEPVVAAYKLYTRLKSESRLSKNPSFNGFSVIDLQQPDASGYSRETLNGKEYNVYTIRKAQLYPLQSGPIELETATLDNVIQFIKEDESRSGDIFGISPDAMIPQSVSLSSKPVTIDVKPLPEEGKPASFAGAVGHFSVEWMLEKNSFSTDETGTLAVKVSGEGNLQLVTTPDINWPAGIEPFEPKLKESLVNTTVPVSGSKVFHFSFAAQEEGSYTLPALEFSYFDPHAGMYKRSATAPLTFTVTKGTGVPAAQFNEPAKKQISWLNNIFHHRWWIIVFIMGVVITGLYFWLRKDLQSTEDAVPALPAEDTDADKMEAVVAESVVNQQNPLEESEACLYQEDCMEFYSLLNREMKKYLAQRFSINVSDINSKTIAAAMDSSNIQNDTVLQLQQLLQEIEWRLYTPFGQEDKRSELYSRSHALIQLINTYSVNL